MIETMSLNGSAWWLPTPVLSGPDSAVPSFFLPFFLRASFFASARGLFGNGIINLRYQTTSYNLYRRSVARVDETPISYKEGSRLLSR